MIENPPNHKREKKSAKTIFDLIEVFINMKFVKFTFLFKTKKTFAPRSIESKKKAKKLYFWPKIAIFVFFVNFLSRELSFTFLNAQENFAFFLFYDNFD